MADHVTVRVHYSEIVDKVGDYMVDLDEVRLWRAGYVESKVVFDDQPTAYQIKEFIKATQSDSEVIDQLDDWEAVGTELSGIHSLEVPDSQGPTQ